MNRATTLFDTIDGIRVDGFAWWHFLLVGVLIYQATWRLRQMRLIVRTCPGEITPEARTDIMEAALSWFVLGTALSIWLLFGSAVAKYSVTLWVLVGSYQDVRGYAAALATGTGKFLGRPIAQRLGVLVGAVRFVALGAPLVTLVWLVRHGE